MVTTQVEIKGKNQIRNGKLEMVCALVFQALTLGPTWPSAVEMRVPKAKSERVCPTVPSQGLWPQPRASRSGRAVPGACRLGGAGSVTVGGRGHSSGPSPEFWPLGCSCGFAAL